MPRFDWKPRSMESVPPSCPRCTSTNTKFCYFNNYSLAQPRYFCKSCRRYWTKGGALRNVPIGGGCRKNRRAVRRVPPDVLNDDRSKNVAITVPKENVSKAATPWGIIGGDSAITNVEMDGFRINGCDRSVSGQIDPDLFGGQDFVFVDDWCNNFGVETLWQLDGGDFMGMESMAKIQDRDQMLFSNNWGSFDFYQI